MGKESFIIYKSFYKPISKLSDKQLGRLFRAIFEYNISGVVSVEEDIEMAFEFFKNQFEIDESKYQGKVERNRENGRRGGIQRSTNNQSESSERYHSLPNANESSERYPSQANQAYNDNENDNDNDNVYVSLSMREITHTDTESFLRILLFDKHLIKPQEELDRFLAYYSKTGWLDRNGNKIVDKVAALKSWDCKGKTYERTESVSRWHQIVNRIENNCDHRKCPNGRLDRIPFLADFRGLTQENGTLTLYCSNTLREALESVLNQKIVAALNELEIRKINYRKKD